MAKPSPRCITCRIKNCSVLKNCKPDILDELSDHKKYLSFKKGERLITEGDTSSAVYFIQTGIAKVELTGDNGRPLILRLIGEGTIFGHRINSVQNAQPLTIVAVDNMNVCQISLACYQELIKKSPELHVAITRSLLEEIHSLEIRSLHLAHLSVKEKIADALMQIASAYKYQQGGKSIHVQLDRQDIADMAGTTKEQVSKILAQFHDEGLIKFRARHFRFFDLMNLGNIARSGSFVRA